ncbi:MAG TPA: sulfur carrier protein ThiS [Gammaproteobacteria bacterium]|nr:sulfur carrier protein ThiS [Gammaproteobacteria bacterium]
MQIWLNGETREIREGLTLRDLVRDLGLEPQGVAVEVNREVVPRGSHAEYRISDGDRIEVVRAIGGG